MGLLLLTLTICGLVLHSWLIIETQLNEFILGKLLLKSIIAKVNVSFTNLKVYTMLCFFVKYLWMFNMLSTEISP